MSLSSKAIVGILYSIAILDRWEEVIKMLADYNGEIVNAVVDRENPQK